MTAGAAALTTRVDADGRAWLPGLGEPLPAGERVRWVGRPDAAALARRVLHVRGLALYFAALVCLTAAVRWHAGAGAAIGDALVVAAMGAAVVAFARVYAAAIARATLYAVTDRRVVVRAGVALPAVLNVPLDQITSVDLRRGRDGVGDVELTIRDDARIAYLLLWPHARPWHVAHPRPTFRALRDADAGGVALAAAVRAAQSEAAVDTRAVDASTSATVRADITDVTPALAA